jgi:hypothetical protein
VHLMRGLMPICRRNPIFRRSMSSFGRRRRSQEAEGKAASKIRYTCPVCDLHAWAPPDTKLICGECEQPYRPTRTSDLRFGNANMVSC